MNRPRFKLKIAKHQAVMLCMIFATCFVGALYILPKYCPDEWARQLLTNWIYQNNRLPHGNEAEILIGNYGYSYALRPYLTSMINAAAMKIVSVFTQSERFLRLASRASSLLAVTACFYFLVKIGNSVFHNKSSSTIFAAMIVFLPQVMFLGMYQNNDIFGLAGVTAVLFFLLYAMQNHWTWKACTGLSIAVAVCLLSYYSIYGWLLISGIVFLFSFFRDKNLDRNTRIKRLAMMFSLVLILAGWFFIRNALIHNGDFFGMATEERNRAELMAQGIEVFKYDRPAETEGNTVFKMLLNNDYHWLRVSQKSIIGVFGYMNIWLQERIYYFYYAIFGISVLLYILTAIYLRKQNKEERIPFLIIGFSSLITLALSIWHSFSRDYQPQGRYIITVSLFFTWMMASGENRIALSLESNDNNQQIKKLNTAACRVFIGVWILMFYRIFFETMTGMFIE